MASVALLGNIANVHYRLARALRDHGVDAHLYIGEDDVATWRPESDDAALADAYPEWIHEGPWINAASLLAPRRAPITRELARFDTVMVSGNGPVFAQHCGRPWTFFVTGGDLTVTPFPIAFRHRPASVSRRIGRLVAGVHQRRAIRRASRVVMQPFSPMQEAADRLNVPAAARHVGYLPLVVDTGAFSPGAAPTDLLEDADFVVFHPSRLVVDDRPIMRRTGQWKGNDALVRGFAEFVATGDRSAPRLVLVDSTASQDRAQVRALIDELGIGAYVHWVQTADGEPLRREQMVAWYRRADVVADEFGVGWFGYVTLEAAATATPVVSHVDEATMAELYPSHPILNAPDVGSICDRLRAVAAGDPEAASSGRRGRDWVVRHHSAAAVQDRYVAELIDDRAWSAANSAANPAPSAIRAVSDAPPVGAVDA